MTGSARRPRPRWPLAVASALTALMVAALALIARDVPTVRAWWQNVSGAPYHGGEFTPPLALPALSLQHVDGGVWTTAATRGRVSLFFFGFTNCPDVCPTTMLELAEIRRQLGPAANRLDAYFVTVDPARDTPERLREWVGRFDPTVIPLTGNAEQQARLREAFMVLVERRDLPGSAVGYTLDHSASIYLVDGEGRLRLLFPFGMTAEEIAEDVRRVAL